MKRSLLPLTIIVASQPSMLPAKPAMTSATDIASAMRAATIEPSRQNYINAMQVYAYSEGAIYHAYTAPGSITDLALQPGEALIAVASGDTTRWIIGDTTSGSGPAQRVHILVKPVSAGLVTSLVITTDRRAYHLRLSSTVLATMAGLRWTYPQDEMLALRGSIAAAGASAPVASGIEVEQLNFTYTISGDQPSWRPLRAFDDGHRTYIEFPASLSQGEAPPLFSIDADGDVELVNYRLRGRFYVVDRILDRAELRFGLKKQIIVRIDRAPATRRRGA
ncbi:P-type conjugative transfer protein TrbG [Sphingomonas sp. C8-2]|nr:P-type conjugative transfer protein TrbG [Sphingomonas sp. C8-2]